MTSEEKILKVLERIKAKADIGPSGAILDYRAGWELDEIGAEDEILILNKLAEDGAIEVVSNLSSEYE